MSPAPDLVVLGNLIIDDIVFANGSTRMGEAGGAVLYAALGAAIWGCTTGIVSVAGDDYPIVTLGALRGRGVDLGGIRRVPRSLRAWLLYEPEGRRIVHHGASPSHAAATPEPSDIPRSWYGAAAFHLTPSPVSAQGELAARVAGASRGLVSIDPHDPLDESSLDDWRRALACADILFVSEAELRMPEARGRPFAWVERVGSPRLRQVALKRGESGGTLVQVDSGQTVEWRPRTSAIVDPTGAGDAFAGGVLSGCVARLPVEEALRRGVVSASFALEAWGAEALLRATSADAETRLREWYGEGNGPR